MGELVDTVAVRLPADVAARLKAVLAVGESASSFLRAATVVEVERREQEIETKRRAEALRHVENFIAPPSRPRPFGYG